MDRIIHPTAVDIGGGRRGFRSKDTVAGVPGTVVTALHMNAIQEEIMAVIEAGGEVPDPNNSAQLLSVLGFRLKNIIRQPVAGTYIWTKPAWCKAVEIELVGGGGGGGGSASSSGASSFSSGGGGGAWLKKFFLASALSATETYMVGAGGTGSDYNGGAENGTAGGTSTFGSLLSCTGGARGPNMGVNTLPETREGAAGGVATGGDVNVRGGYGDSGFRISSTAGKAGNGGTTPYCMGMIGAGISQVGFPGNGPGGGGGGASSTNGTSGTGSFKGGNGAPGLIIIREYL